MPSMVRTLPPSACTAKTVQDFTDLPSRSTVQAPQWLVSQPICGPVRLRCSRRKWIKRGGGSISAGTRGAVGGVAADMRAGQVEVLAQEVDQQGARLDLGRDLAAVDGHRDPHFGISRHGF